MSFENRGRHKKTKGKETGKTVAFPTIGFTPEGERLKRQWNKLTDNQRAVWGYKFEDYKNAKGK